MAQIFPDVKPGDWYYDSIQRGAMYGLLVGYDDGTYKPENNLTRAEAGVVFTKIFDRMLFMTLLINGVTLTAVMLTQKGK